MSSGLFASRTLRSSLPRLVPIGDCESSKTCLRVVMCQEFGLRLCSVRKLFLKHLCHPIVHFLSFAFEQRVVRSVLYKCVLESIRCVGRNAVRVNQLRVSQPRQRRLQIVSWYLRNGLE